MKRLIALMLALTMMYSIALPVYAQADPEATAVPEPEATAVPEPEATAVPEPEATAVPEPEATAVPEPEATAVPEPEATAVPEPEATAVPEAEATAVPEAEATAVPEAEATATPEPEVSATPEPDPNEDDGLMTLDYYFPSSSAQIDVIVRAAMDFGSYWTPNFTASLDGPDPRNGKPLELNTRCCFEQLPAGMYTLKVTADGFADYTQIIKLDADKNDGVLIQLTAGRMAGFEVAGKPHPGVMVIGDVNGDEKVDTVDLTALQAAVAGGGAEGLLTDLNGDGVTNLADEEYLAKGLKLQAELEAVPGLGTATEEKFVPQSAILPDTGSTTTVASGDINDLCKADSQGVSLAPADGGSISDQSPVEMSFALNDGIKPDEIVIGENNISDAEIFVTFNDGGTEITERFVLGSPAPASVLPEPAQVPFEPQPVTTLPAEDGEADVQDLTSDTPEASEPAEVTEDTTGDELAEQTALSGVLPVPVSRPVLVLRRNGGQPGADVMVIAGTVTVTKDDKGNIVLDLAGQKAVKRVTLRITGTSGEDKSLASIAHVEFVNDMESRIPEPEMNIPGGLAVLPGSRQFTFSWGPETNITGYEVEITDGVHDAEYVSLTGTSLTVTNFNNDEVLNYTTYYVRVRSVNGSWQSPWSGQLDVTPKPTGRPDKPDNVKAVGGFQTVTVTWKNMKDTETYNLYYKEKDTDAEFTQLPGLTVTSYVISGLDSTKATTYEVYVTGVNEHGESDQSLHAEATTSTMNPPEMPQFNLINRDANGNPGRDHILSAVLPNTSGRMVNSPADEAGGTAWATVDNNPASYYERETWNDGGWWSMSSSVGLFYTFDQEYTMDTIAMMSLEEKMDYTYVRVRWWDETGEHMYTDDVMRSERRTDAQGRTYFFLRMPEPITTSRIQIGVARYWAGNNRVAISDIYFYKYDDLKGRLDALYADDLHTTLKDDPTIVSEEILNQLKTDIENSKDEFGHENPDKDMLLREWETAWQIFKDQFLSKVTYIHTGITDRDDNHGFSGLNAWQPLGVTAAAGEDITVYVGHNFRESGSATNLRLIATQYHAESSALYSDLGTLKVGANHIRVNKVWTNTGVESGGALYVVYTGGASTADVYAVRVSGGVSVPVLDLYGVTGGERATRTTAYLNELQTYVAGMQAKHAKVHQGADAEGKVNTEVNYPYEDANCILGATDIMLDTMMLSIPAQQVIKGCDGDPDTLLRSLDAMESMMYLFYQHKGLNAAAKDQVDRIPFRHLNIRYQRMFSGAFMYASGNHIGIEWNETAGMAGCGGVTASDSGLYQSGSYFGWGIAHEIGHDINQGTYAIAEITNNYFAVLAQAQDTNESVRFEYPKVYEKVTSGAKGRAGNVFTQLGMYWQLHLAYDTGYNFKTYSDYNEQFANLFWARVDTYARTPSKAPGKLVLEGADIEQALMRLACAAANRNILEFFERWGKTPDAATVEYASQFDKETRAIYYVCDDSRRYTIEHAGPSQLASDGSTDAIDSVSVTVDPNVKNKVDITISPSATVPTGEILGYEIVRCTIAGGVTERKTVGFSTTNTFSDTVYAMNNRSVSYEVTLVDQYLNRSAVESTGMVKIQHDGVLAKDNWTVSTTGLKADPIKVEHDEKDPDSSVEDAKLYDAAAYIADGKVETVYTGTVEAAGASIEIDFHENLTVTGFKYTAGAGTPLGVCGVEVRQNGEWVKVVESADLSADATVYFPSAVNEGSKGHGFVSTYSADALRLTLTQTSGTVSAAEIDVMGPSGDNVDFRVDQDGSPAIGYLAADFVYDVEKDYKIPEGSLVFTGTYKGNAAYNIVMVYDDTGSIVTGVEAKEDGVDRVADQTILCTVPDQGNIQDVYDGTWIYWIEPQYMDANNGFAIPKRVRVELYRVNNALTAEGERLVSDSLFVDVPETLQNITIDNGVG